IFLLVGLDVVGVECRNFRTVVDTADISRLQAGRTPPAAIKFVPPARLYGLQETPVLQIAHAVGRPAENRPLEHVRRGVLAIKCIPVDGSMVQWKRGLCADLKQCETPSLDYVQ